MTRSRARLLVLLLLSGAVGRAAEFHVSLDGRDDGPGTREKPFASIARARDAVRGLRGRGPAEQPTEVVIHGGTYHFPETLLLTPADSGTAESPVIYRAAEGERVILSGGLRIDGLWTNDTAEVWSAAVPHAERMRDFRQLFVNGRREVRARYPNIDAQPPHLFGGGGRKDSIQVAAGVIKPAWGTARDAQIHVVPEWRFFNQLQTITGVDRERSLILLGPQEQHARITDGSWFHVEGVREELDQAREWHFDAEGGLVLYLPGEGRDPNALEIVAPRLNRILHMRGDVGSDTHVEHVHLRGLEFQHTTYTLGHIEARVNTDAAVLLENARSCRIEHCRFEHVGGYGIWLHLDSCGNTIEGNTIADAGGGGVLLTSARFSYLDDSKLFTPGPAAAKVSPLRNEIVRNHIHHCGQVRCYNSGVHLDSRPAETALAAGNRIANNHIHDMARNGIFAFRNQGGNIIEYNRIENIMLATVDGGGIHFATMNQVAAPNRIAHNLVADVWGWRQRPGGRERHIARGIYLDWFTAATRVEFNLVYNTRAGGLQFNAGDDNEFINNVVVGDRTRWDIHWRGANAQRTVDERNVVVPTAQDASPLRDPARGDYTLARTFAGYPAGFMWIDVDQIGTSGTARSGIELAAMARAGGVLNWDAPQGVEIRGPWAKQTAPGMWGLYEFRYLLAGPADDAAISFSLPVPQDGLYDVRVMFPEHSGRASNVPVEIEHAGGTALAKVDMRTFGFGPRIGRYRFQVDRPARVTLRTAGANGTVAVEGIGFVCVDAVEESRR